MRCVLRCDAGSVLGLGHAYRALAVAHAIHGNASLTLMYRSMPTDIQEQFQRLGVSLVSVSGLDFQRELDVISEFAEVAILDGYDFDIDYQNTLRRRGIKVVLIDDFAKGPFVADCVINHCPGLNEDLFISSVPPSYTKFKVGPTYALLRPDFWLCRRDLNFSPNEPRVIIAMGGADPQNDTMRFLKLCLENFPDISCEIIIGKSNSNFTELKSYVEDENSEHIIFHVGLDALEMAQVMARATLLICPASTIALEACAVGTPILVRSCVENQSLIYRGLLECGLARGMKNDHRSRDIDLTRAIDDMLSDSGIRERMIRAQRLMFQDETSQNLRKSIFE